MTVNKKTAFNILAEVTREKMYDSTIHGIGAFLRSDCWLVRLMWVFFGCACLGYCIFLVTNSLINYFAYAVTVVITRVQELPATFPAVTICNVNPFYEDTAYPYIRNKTSEVECFLATDGNQFQQCLNASITNYAFDSFVEKMKRIIANDKNLTAEDHLTYGFDLKKDMLVSCSFNGIPCTANDFTKYWSNSYGNCYTFNYGNETKNLLKTSAIGDQYGLKLELAASK